MNSMTTIEVNLIQYLLQVFPPSVRQLVPFELRESFTCSLNYRPISPPHHLSNPKFISSSWSEVYPQKYTRQLVNYFKCFKGISDWLKLNKLLLNSNLIMLLNRLPKMKCVKFHSKKNHASLIWNKLQVHKMKRLKIISNK